MDRRTFLTRAAGAFGTLTIPVLSSCSSQLMNLSSIDDDATGLSAGQWQTMAAVQGHLLPSEPGSPGAQDINATGYLRWVLSDPKLDPADRELIIDGLIQFEGFCRGKTGQHFVALSTVQREEVLRGFEKGHHGRHWIGEVFGYVFEALLGDPVYGGNPNGIGWKWLNHQPGFPRPPASKRYFLL